jgi:hypothetical protein
MKGWMQQFRRFALVLCCTTLPFFHSQARAEAAGNVVHTTAKAAVLMELVPSQDDSFMQGRWHYGVDRLEVALRNFFGVELEGMRVLVSVLPDDRIYLLCCTMLGQEGPETSSMAGLVTSHAQASIDHVREYLDLHLSIAGIRVLPNITALSRI